MLVIYASIGRAVTLGHVNRHRVDRTRNRFAGRLFRRECLTGLSCGIVIGYEKMVAPEHCVGRSGLHYHMGPRIASAQASIRLCSRQHGITISRQAGLQHRRQLSVRYLRKVVSKVRTERMDQHGVTVPILRVAASPPNIFYLPDSADRPVRW
jgi:hypothetical protein